jgi:phosphate transport system protein
MRDAYHAELAAIGEQLVEMTRLVGSAMSRATRALLDADLTMAESVIEQDRALDKLRDDLDERSFTLLARQQPVATDLRAIVTGLRISADLERMGDLAVHVAKVARMRYPRSAVPAHLFETILEMGEAAQRIVAKLAGVIASRNVQQALELEQDDDEMDRLHVQLFRVLLDDRWTDGIEPAVDVTLVGRYYERFADHAVSVARRVVYLVTGERPDRLPSPYGAAAR